MSLGFYRLAALTAALVLAGCASQPAPKADQTPVNVRADVAVLETTDLHANVLSYDYYKQKDDPTLGFERTVTLIRRARSQFTNTLLFDAGDTIQELPTERSRSARRRDHERERERNTDIERGLRGAKGKDIEKS